MTRAVRFAYGWLIHCPGCDGKHLLRTDPGTDDGRPAPCWTFDGDQDRPTFSPSLVVQVQDSRCHSFIRAGRIEFLQDSTHHLAGQTVDLPPCPRNS